MANVFDVLDRFQLFVGLSGGAFDVIEIAVDELDRFEDRAWGFAFPYFAKTAAAKRRNQAIARYRFSVRLFGEWHSAKSSPVACKAQGNWRHVVNAAAPAGNEPTGNVPHQHKSRL